MAELRSAIFWVLCPKQSLHCYSSGLGAMVVILQRVRSKGAKLYLCSLNDQIKITLKLTKMDKVFDILSDRAAFDALIS